MLHAVGRVGMARVSVESVKNVQVRIKAEDYEWIGDEPPDVGDGMGPGPYDLLLGALGSCMTMTLLLYARRKEWPLEGVEVDIEHDRIHADDAVNVEKPGGLVERFKINLVLRGDLNEVQVERLRDISTRCPMRKTLAATHVFEESVRLSE
jgi:putative redox protein